MLPAEGASPPEVFREILARRAPAFALSLPDAALERLARFLAELDRARRRTNLTGPLTATELVDHALESALGERLIPHGAEVIDIGSGAGFPGLPLAATRPDIHVTPIEPRKKRIDFLRLVATAVPLENVAPAQPSLAPLPPGVADVATVRAVGSIDQVLAGATFLSPKGLLLAWTTETQALASRLRRFWLEEELPVPGSRRKVIAAFRKAGVPRGT